MKRNQNAIGILDSGVGGLTVAKEVMRQLPKETIYYFGDTLRCPYGPRPTEEVEDFVHEIVSFLMQFPLKAILIACNTATAAAIDSVKERFDIPVLGVIEPGSRAAIKVSRRKKIAVIGTQGTIQSGAYERMLKSIHPELRVFSLACPEFVPIVEQGLYHTAEAESIVRRALLPLTKMDIDTLILGCTHYPLLQHFIAQTMGDQVKIISSAEETAAELSSLLYHQNLLSEHYGASNRFFATGSTKLFQRIAEEWFGEKVEVEKVELDALKKLTT